jgi:hypothetical protein
MLEVNTRRAGLKSWEEAGKAAGWSKPVYDGENDEHDAEEACE